MSQSFYDSQEATQQDAPATQIDAAGFGEEPEPSSDDEQEIAWGR
jgi:hypothetical protein